MKTATHRSERRSPLPQFLGVVREFAEGSLMVILFASAIVLLGLPVALAVKAVHAIVFWFAGAA
jgi:hypothetical protein